MSQSHENFGANKRKLIDDCFLHDKDRLRHDEALSLLRERLTSVTASESVDLADSQKRILADAISAPRNVPLHDNAAVDGYAFRHADIAGRQGAHRGRLEVVARIAAGDLDPAPLAEGTAVRIFTGAIAPEGADTIAMQEDCEAFQDKTQTFVDLPVQLKAGANLRLAGEDVQAGETLLQAGHLLRPQDVATIAALGQSRVEVQSRLKVALISTGNEVKRPGETIQPGEVYDANHFLLGGLLAGLPVSITDFGIIADERGAVEAALQQAAQSHDVILTTGGASRGDEDHIVSAIDALGTRHLWQLAVKPGRPMSFGQIGDTVHMGLPGNPVAVMVCFLLYVYPSLLRLAGGNWQQPRRYPLPAQFDISSKPDRREFLRGILETSKDDGLLGVSKYPRDGSGLISSLREADGLIEVAEEVTSVSRGEQVSFIPFSEFGIV